LLSQATTAFDGLRVITCHDDHAVLRLITETLRSTGCRVIEAYDGLSCYELAHQISPLQLLVVNSRLGAMDGPTLVEHVRTELPHIAILHVGPDPERRLPPDLPQLAEPFSPDELLAAVSRLWPHGGKDSEATTQGASPGFV
jgi:two-component system cell cycle sensor histidine kinase/response regulator CckA